MERTYNFPVWGTQGGGLVREVNGTHIFVEKPDCPGLDVGDEMPAEWGVVPANIHAQGEMDRVDREEKATGRCLTQQAYTCCEGERNEKHQMLDGR